MKYVVFIFSLGILLNSQAQIQTDTTNGIYVGKMKYSRKGTISTYKIQFPIDFDANIEIDDQVLNEFPYRKKPFHFSVLQDTSFGSFIEGIFLLKGDSFFNAIHFFSKRELEEYWCEDEGCTCCSMPDIKYEKGKWNKFTQNCSLTVWDKRFKGYRLAVMYDDYVYQGYRKKFIFISKPLK